MTLDLIGVHLKQKRAKQHLDALTELVEVYESRNPYRTVLESNPDRTAHVWTARISEQPPIASAPLIGDFLFNLRSALDNLAWAHASTAEITVWLQTARHPQDESRGPRR